ncbi:hypothetical protein DRO54_06220 [Candidatus Bathyarchaeota archaeon]|nr:MAG: hypothetical protein DRO54_06220 [Candidatus Bathyarchaeota archaeon]
MVGQIYIVRVEMSSPYRVAETEHPDEDTVVLKYYFPAETRKKIMAVRNKYKYKIYKNTVSFYGLQLADEELVPKIREIVEEADSEMRAIHESLGVRMILIPISREAVEQGELYQKILYAIQYQIAKAVFERIKDIKSARLQPKTRMSIKEMLENMKKLNILKDEKIDRMIDDIKHMLDLTTKDLREKIFEQLDYINRLLQS